jgi:endonuclease/exonuclease/phosphatase family metal-dependent hydrolase
MKRLISCMAVWLGLSACLMAREFTVMVYNVENLFDLDGVAKFGDYQPPPEGSYGTEQFLNKIRNISHALAAVNDGKGPEVVLFQEFELDLTPFGTPSPEAFMEMTMGRSLEELLLEEDWVSGLPAELLLLKYLEDSGLKGYRIAQPDAFRMEHHTPHKNVIFSRFPVKVVRQRTLLQARDLLVAVLDVDGHELIVLDNHWKSGASDPNTESIRVQNALVVRAELESILSGNPMADVLIAGDLNCYYNQKAVFADRFDETGINDVLPTHGSELSITKADAGGLYNLWYDLPPEQRGSEVYRGYWGTLMQILLAPGFYDRKGIQYIDNSFDRLMLSGDNVDRRWGRPLRWSNLGGGVGYSDHLPVLARFRVVPGEGGDGWMALTDPSDQSMTDFRPKVNFARLDRRALPEADSLAGLSERERAGLIGELFRLDHPLTSERPARVTVGDMEMQIYSPVRDTRTALNDMKVGDRLNAFVTLETYRGKFQLVVHDPGWIHAPDLN